MHQPTPLKYESGQAINVAHAQKGFLCSLP